MRVFDLERWTKGNARSLWCWLAALFSLKKNLRQWVKSEARMGRLPEAVAVQLQATTKKKYAEQLCIVLMPTWDWAVSLTVKHLWCKSLTSFGWNLVEQFRKKHKKVRDSSGGHTAPETKRKTTSFIRDTIVERSSCKSSRVQFHMLWIATFHRWERNWVKRSFCCCLFDVWHNWGRQKRKTSAADHTRAALLSSFLRKDIWSLIVSHIVLPTVWRFRSFGKSLKLKWYFNLADLKACLPCSALLMTHSVKLSIDSPRCFALMSLHRLHFCHLVFSFEAKAADI